SSVTACTQPKATLAHNRPLAYWVEGLEGRDVKLRRQAAKVLGNIGPVDDSIIPTLSRAVKDPDPVVRKEAILSLTKFGSKAAEALSALEDASRDRDARVRASAAKAIKAIQAIP